MNLRLIREPSKGGATLGSLYINDVRICDTLEDQLREQFLQPVTAWKVKGETAIPAGRYRIVMRQSPRFGRVLPWLQDVPGFEWILIHAGNKSADTEGCILVGLDRGHAFVGRSQMALQRVMQQLVDAAGEIWISIENPPSYPSVNEA